MKHIPYLLLIIIASCTSKFKVERFVEADPQLKLTQVRIKKIYDRCELYVFPIQKEELIASQQQWMEDMDDQCKSVDDIKECLNKSMNERLESLEANCALKSEKEFASKTSAAGVYEFRALCGSKPCPGVEGKMQVWNINPNFIYMQATTKIKGGVCKCELSGEKTKEGHFVKFHQPSSQCDGTLNEFGKPGSLAMDIDSCGYCCTTKAGLRGEWKLKK